MVLHNTQAMLERAYIDAHASDEFLDEDEFAEDISPYTCMCCGAEMLYEYGEWTCQGEC